MGISVCCRVEGWFGLRKDFCSWMLIRCPTLQEYGNVHIKRAGSDALERDRQEAVEHSRQQLLLMQRTKKVMSGDQMAVLGSVMVLDMPDWVHSAHCIRDYWSTWDCWLMVPRWWLLIEWLLIAVDQWLLQGVDWLWLVVIAGYSVCHVVHKTCLSFTIICCHVCCVCCRIVNEAVLCTTTLCKNHLLWSGTQWLTYCFVCNCNVWYWWFSIKLIDLVLCLIFAVAFCVDCYLAHVELCLLRFVWSDRAMSFFLFISIYKAFYESCGFNTVLCCALYEYCDWRECEFYTTSCVNCLYLLLELFIFLLTSKLLTLVLACIVWSACKVQKCSNTSILVILRHLIMLQV